MISKTKEIVALTCEDVTPGPWVCCKGCHQNRHASSPVREHEGYDYKATLSACCGVPELTKGDWDAAVDDRRWKEQLNGLKQEARH